MKKGHTQRLKRVNVSQVLLVIGSIKTNTVCGMPRPITPEYLIAVVLDRCTYW